MKVNEEMEATVHKLLDAGHAEQTVLPFMTSNVARLLKLHHKGHVATGFDADLVVFDPGE